MNPSYNNSFGGFNQGVVLTGASRGGSGLKKTLAVVFSVIGIAVLAIVAIVFFTRSSYSFEQKVKDFYNGFSWVSLSSQCSRVRLELENKNYTNKMYESLVGECRENALKMKELMNDLDGKGDQTFKDIYNKIKFGVSEVMIFGEDLEEELKMYSAWHSFYLNVQSINNESADVEIENAIKPLINSGNDILETYGNNWAEKRVNLNFAYLNLEVFPDDLNMQSTFNEVERDLLDYINNNKPDVIKMTRIGEIKEFPEFQKLLNELRDYLKENYEE